MMEEYKDTLSDEAVAEMKASTAPNSAQGGEVTEEEFVHFIERNAEYYLAKFEKFETNGADKFSVTWLWPAFFFTCLWMAYRKMYLWAIAAFVMEGILYDVHPSLAIFPKVLFAIVGNYLYYKHTKRKIIKLKTREVFSDSSELLTALERKGGVNYWMALISIVIYVLGLIASKS